MSEKRDITPSEIRYDKESRTLTVSYEDGTSSSLTAEFLRVYSPSAVVRGHAPGQEILQVGKEDVAIEKIDPVGNYAISIKFDDGHDSGIYSWEWLKTLGDNQDRYWQEYLSRLEAEGIERMTTSQRLAT
jgi:DUF971 family protein